MKLKLRNPFKKKEPVDQETCPHKRTSVHEPKTGVSLHKREICNRCGKVLKSEQPSHYKLTKKQKKK